MALSLTVVLVIFTLGFVVFRGTQVRLALGTGVVLGVLLAHSWLGHVVHTLDGVFRSFT